MLEDTYHEFVLAPSLKPFGNATESNGANQFELSRGSCPAPQESEISPVQNASEANSEPITREQAKTDRTRARIASQPQPTVNTKVLEATSYSVPKNGSDKPFAHDHGEVSSNIKDNQFRNNNRLAQTRHRRGSLDDEDSIYRRSYRAGAYTSSSESDSQVSEKRRYANRGKQDLAPDHMQPTNEGDGDIGKGFQLPRDSDDEDNFKNLAEGSMPADPDDPDAIYRLTTEKTQPFDTEVDGSTIKSTKMERRAERKERRAKKRQKLVKDPITQQDIWIENARGSIKKFMAQDGVIAPDYKTQHSQTEKSAADIVAQLHKVPFKDDKTNLLFYPMEPPEWKEFLEESQMSLFRWGYTLIFVLVSTQLFLSFIPVRYSIYLNAISAIVSIIFVKNRVESSFTTAFAEAERVRGEHATLSAVPESVEWLNNIVRTIWPTINPELFAGPIDLLEDAMQKQVPNVVHTVKVSDLDIGSIPLRVLSMRFLPDDGSPRGDEDAAGEYVNLEVSFGYRAGKTDKNVKSKAKSIHLLIWFLVGLRNVLGVPIPIWVQIHGILGKARVRIQLLPDPPFLKNGTLSLLGMPKIELSTVPISTRFINVMYLPFVSQLVAFAVKIVLKDVIAPRSYTMDVSKLMVGDDVKKETSAIGILMLAIHGATDVPRSDHGPGRSKVDPYVTVQYSKYGKTKYSTRAIHQDYNPVWEETCFIPVLPAAVKAGEKIRLNLWDSDRLSADDLLGRVEIDLTDLVVHPGVFQRRIDRVVGTPRAKLHWSIGFYGKRPVPDQDIPTVQDLRIPEPLRNDPDFKEKERLWSVDSKAEQLVCRTAPEMDYPGIVSVQIHQIDDLGVIRSKSKIHNRQGRVLEAEAVEQGKEDDSGAAPSAYCAVSLNDELIYKTRTRAYTNRPIFNASFERFVRTFKDTEIRITVRDQRFREDDPIIGILPLKIREELASQGQVTRWYPLSEGIGYGQIRVSLLYRAIDCKIPRTLQGWNLGTLHIYSIRAVVGDEDVDALKDCSLRIDTMLGHKTIGAVHAQKEADNHVSWDLGGTIVMPIRRRHATSLNIEAHRGGVPFTKKGLFSGIYGASIIALSAVDDDERGIVSIPIFQTNDYVRFKQNSLTQEGTEQDSALRRLGDLQVDCVLYAGLSDHHRRFVKRNRDLAQTHESWETENFYRKRLVYDEKLGRTADLLRARRSREDSGRNTADVTSLARTPSKSVQFQRDSEDAALQTLTTEELNALADEEQHWLSDDAESTHSGRRNVKTWFANKQEERRERHRRHRGIMQQKPARTISWMKNGIKRGLSRASRAMTLSRDDQLVEREIEK